MEHTKLTENDRRKSRRVLMVAYEFPPLAAGGVARSKVFAEFLSDHNWNPIVLTPQSPYGRESQDSINIPSAEIVRTKGIDIESTLTFFLGIMKFFGFKKGKLPGWLEWRVRSVWQPLCFPDATAGWALINIPRACYLAVFRHVDAVYTTSWPYADHLVGLAIKKFISKPWVADFRDPYIRHLNYGTPGKYRDRFNRWLERKICEKADSIISPTDLATEQLKKDYGYIDPSKFVTIRNGFDETEFNGHVDMETDFSILHSGALYLSRRPDVFLEAVERVASFRPDFDSAVSVTFMGVSQDDNLDIKSYEKYKFVKFLGWRPRNESIRAIRSSKVLLLIRHPECSLTIPGKIYEYMASGNFIFAITGLVDELDIILKEYSNKVILRNPTLEELVDAINLVFDLFLRGDLKSAKLDCVSDFSRQAACRKLAKLLDNYV